LESFTLVQAYMDVQLWTTCTAIICFMIFKWHQFDRVRLLFHKFFLPPLPPNNLDNLYKLTCEDELMRICWQSISSRWYIKQQAWANVDWSSNARIFFHTYEYMEWYIMNSTYFLFMPQLLYNPRTKKNPQTQFPFQIVNTLTFSYQVSHQHPITSPNFINR